MFRICGGRSILVLLLLGVPAIPAFSGELSTYDLVRDGKQCKTWNQALSCEYTVGTGLKFSIDGIGQPDTGITFMESSFEGDFYVTYGLFHGCVVVKRGPKGVNSEGMGEPGSINDYAFVSPENGKIYKSWQKCKSAF